MKVLIILSLFSVSASALTIVEGQRARLKTDRVKKNTGSKVKAFGFEGRELQNKGKLKAGFRGEVFGSQAPVGPNRIRGIGKSRHSLGDGVETNTGTFTTETKGIRVNINDVVIGQDRP